VYCTRHITIFKQPEYTDKGYGSGMYSRARFMGEICSYYKS